MIYTVTLNPALDKTVTIENFESGKVNRIKTVRIDPGGKGINVSKAVASLGAQTCAAGIIAGNTGRQLKELLGGVLDNTCFLDACGETRTNLKVTDPVTGNVTDINEPGPRIAQDTVEKLLELVCGRIGQGDIVVLSGSLPAGVAPDTYRVWTEQCSKKQALVILDAEGEALREGLKAGPWLVKPNDSELEKYAGKKLETTEDICISAKKLLAAGARNAVVSLGSRGALFLYEGITVLAKGLKVPVISTVGAGDCMVAAIAYCKGAGLSAADTARLAVAMSAAKVMCSGSQAPDIREVNRLFREVQIEKM